MVKARAGGRVKAGSLLIVLSTMAMASIAAAQGLRVVDVVTVGDRVSEAEHEYSGDGVIDGTIDGKPYRQTRGSLSYALNVFDDTEVTVVCLFRGTEGRPLAFDLLVEGRKVKTSTLVTPSAAPSSVEIRIPRDFTRNLTRIFITLRAVDGPTPGLLELRTVQEHLERHPA